MKFRWPIIRYTRKGEEPVYVKLPDDTDPFEFLAYLDEKFMGITPAERTRRNAMKAMRK